MTLTSDFVGSKDYIEDSQAANQNMHNLMEILRPVWESPDSKKAQEILNSNDGFKVSLLDADGNQRPNFTLYLEHVNNDEKEILDLCQIIRDRIEEGVEKFFLAMKEAFAAGIAGNEYDVLPLKDIDTFTIFLAGNSSKAEVVHELFDEYIGNVEEEDIPCKALEILGVEALPKFMVEEPLGMHSHDYAKPNGKTGVAFGLLICREGGEDIRVIDITPDKNTIPFLYYIGRNRKRKFKNYLTPNSKMNEWVDFIDAGGNFEIYYTDDPSVLNDKASIGVAKGMFNIKIDKADAKARVYIRPIDSHRIEWRIGENADAFSIEVDQEKVIELN